MRKIYGARRIDEEIVQLLVFKGGTRKHLINILDNKQPIKEEDLLDVTIDEYTGDIPQCFQIDFTDFEHLAFDKRVSNRDRYIKELDPDKLLQPTELIPHELCRDVGDWLIFRGKGVCYLPQVDWRLDKKGYELNDTTLAYNYHKPVKVLRRGKIRYMGDEEVQDFLMDIQTSRCYYRHRFFKEDRILDVKHIFDLDNRVWRVIDVKVEHNIIAIKR